MKDVIKNYSNEGLTVNWDSKKCIHAAECVKNAPKVFRPKEQPWVNLEGGSTEEVTKAIDKCPSGALSFTRK